MAVDNIPKRVRELIDELYDSANLTNKKRLDELLRTLSASMVPAAQGGEMRVEAMVSMNTRNPVVEFVWNANRGELSPVEARGYALQILSATEAAIQDATLLRALTRVDKKPDAEANALKLIQLVRSERGHFEGGDND